MLFRSIATVLEHRIEKVGIEYEREGRTEVILAGVRGDGRVDVWVRERLGSLRMTGRGYRSTEVTLMPESGNTILGVCRLLKQ